MHVEMEDLLPGSLASGMHDIHSVGGKHGLHQSGDSMHHSGDVSVSGLGDRPRVPRMLTRNDQCVPSRSRGDVKERHRVLVLKDTVGGQPPSDDLAEGAVGHPPDDRIRPSSTASSRSGLSLHLAHTFVEHVGFGVMLVAAILFVKQGDRAGPGSSGRGRP